MHEHLRTSIHLSDFRINTLQAGPDLVKWQKKSQIFMSSNPHINFSMKLDVSLRNSGPLGKLTKDQSSCILPGRDWRQLRYMTILYSKRQEKAPAHREIQSGSASF
jgi:hypothetical protein